MATINGTSANDVLAGSAADDVLAGLAGDDSLDGGGGANTYLFNPGDGNDTLEAQAANGFADDILQLGAGFTIGNLRLNRPGDSDNLKITFTNSPTDSLTVYGHFQGAAFEFANVRFSDGSTLDIRTSGLTLPVYHQGMPYSDSLYGFDGVDIMYGGDTNAPDELYGYGGNDTLDGQGGGDVMVGGAGDDTYYVDSADDVVSELAGQGTDLVYSSLSLDLSDDVENLVLTTTGNLNGTGNARNNRLTGNSGSNSLDGKTGADTLHGGAGDDRYYVDNAGDVVTELAGEGSDFVYSSLNAYTLTNEVERLYLLGSTANGSGNGLDNLLTGNSAANVLSGGGGLDTISALAGNDTLDGGSGADKLYGGLGDDTYVVDDAGDVVSENAGEGVDIVLSSVTLTLKSNVEDLTLTGGANINAYGNTQDNRLTGNSGHNLLDGGQGSDTLSGGLGNDTYVLDVVTDVMVEAAGGGNDTVLAGWTYTLAGNFENLTLTGALAINGTGNGDVNVLTGNGAGNVLDGKAGADSMIGGLGDDRYYVDNAGDLAVETAGNGDDHVYSRVDFSLGLAVERLYLLEGTLARNATGNERNNILTGNSANNIFQGGVGDDLMIGAAGNDTYIYGRGGNADTIKENDATAGNTDVLVFQSGIAHDQLWFRRSGDSLIVNLLGSGEKVSVQGWFGSANNQVEVIRTEDGNRMLLAAQVQNLVTAMAAMAVPVTTTLTVAQHAALDGVIAASWS